MFCADLPNNVDLSAIVVSWRFREPYFSSPAYYEPFDAKRQQTVPVEHIKRGVTEDTVQRSMMVSGATAVIHCQQDAAAVLQRDVSCFRGIDVGGATSAERVQYSDKIDRSHLQRMVHSSRQSYVLAGQQLHKTFSPGIGNVKGMHSADVGMHTVPTLHSQYQPPDIVSIDNASPPFVSCCGDQQECPPVRPWLPPGRYCGSLISADRYPRSQMRYDMRKHSCAVRSVLQHSTYAIHSQQLAETSNTLVAESCFEPRLDNSPCYSWPQQQLSHSAVNKGVPEPVVPLASHNMPRFPTSNLQSLNRSTDSKRPRLSVEGGSPLIRPLHLGLSSQSLPKQVYDMSPAFAAAGQFQTRPIVAGYDEVKVPLNGWTRTTAQNVLPGQERHITYSANISGLPPVPKDAIETTVRLDYANKTSSAVDQSFSLASSFAPASTHSPVPVPSSAESPNCGMSNEPEEVDILAKATEGLFSPCNGDDSLIDESNECSEGFAAMLNGSHCTSDFSGSAAVPQMPYQIIGGNDLDLFKMPEDVSEDCRLTTVGISGNETVSDNGEMLQLLVLNDEGYLEKAGEISSGSLQGHEAVAVEYCGAEVPANNTLRYVDQQLITNKSPGEKESQDDLFVEADDEKNPSSVDGADSGKCGVDAEEITRDECVECFAADSASVVDEVHEESNAPRGSDLKVANCMVSCSAVSQQNVDCTDGLVTSICAESNLGDARNTYVVTFTENDLLDMVDRIENMSPGDRGKKRCQPISDEEVADKRRCCEENVVRQPPVVNDSIDIQLRECEFTDSTKSVLSDSSQDDSAAVRKSSDCVGEEEQEHATAKVYRAPDDHGDDQLSNNVRLHVDNADLVSGVLNGMESEGSPRCTPDSESGITAGDGEMGEAALRAIVDVMDDGGSPARFVSISESTEADELTAGTLRFSCDDDGDLGVTAGGLSESWMLNDMDEAPPLGRGGGEDDYEPRTKELTAATRNCFDFLNALASRRRSKKLSGKRHKNDRRRKTNLQMYQQRVSAKQSREFDFCPADLARHLDSSSSVESEKLNVHNKTVGVRDLCLSSGFRRYSSSSSNGSLAEEETRTSATKDENVVATNSIDIATKSDDVELVDETDSCLELADVVCQENVCLSADDCVNCNPPVDDLSSSPSPLSPNESFSSHMPDLAASINAERRCSSTTLDHCPVLESDSMNPTVSGSTRQSCPLTRADEVDDHDGDEKHQAVDEDDDDDNATNQRGVGVVSDDRLLAQHHCTDCVVELCSIDCKSRKSRQYWKIQPSSVKTDSTAIVLRIKTFNGH